MVGVGARCRLGGWVGGGGEGMDRVAQCRYNRCCILAILEELTRMPLVIGQQKHIRHQDMNQHRLKLRRGLFIYIVDILLDGLHKLLVELALSSLRRAAQPECSFSSSSDWKCASTSFSTCTPTAES